MTQPSLFISALLSVGLFFGFAEASTQAAASCVPLLQKWEVANLSLPAIGTLHAVTPEGLVSLTQLTPGLMIQLADGGWAKILSISPMESDSAAPSDLPSISPTDSFPADPANLIPMGSTNSSATKQLPANSTLLKKRIGHVEAAAALVTMTAYTGLAMAVTDTSFAEVAAQSGVIALSSVSIGYVIGYIHHIAEKSEKRQVQLLVKGL